MKISEVANKTKWNRFVENNTQQTFHQSWEWGQMHRFLGSKTYNYAVFRDDKIIAAFLTIKVCARRGVFLLVPHGPVFNKKLTMSQIQKIMLLIKKQLVMIGKMERCTFIRIAPILQRSSENRKLFKDLGFVKAPIFVQSEQSLVLDLRPDLNLILSQMRKTTRSILKNNQKYNVKLYKSQSADDFENFFKLYKKTVSAKKYTGHQKDFIKAEFDSFSRSKKASLYFCKHEGKIASAAMVILSRKSGFYHYGASDYNIKIPASHLLQWHIINDLKTQGYHYYNFWGIAPDNKPKHPWWGLTVFKKGFGGKTIEFVKTQDFILKKTYFLNWIIETLRRIKRNY